MTTRVLIVSHEAPGERMSGPAIRYWYLARVLATAHDVCLAVPGEPALTSDMFRVVGYERDSGRQLPDLASAADVVIVAGFLLYHYPLLKAVSRPLVVDLYDPFILENLEIHRDKPLATQMKIHEVNLAVLNEQLRLGDFFICAHEGQRDFWLGMLAAHNRVNPYTLGNDPSLLGLIDLVPFGLPEIPPQHRHQVLKGVHPGIQSDDKVVYWGGGLWDWFDPLTAIRAIAEVALVYPDVRLFFAGTRNPNPDVPPMRMCEAARQLSDDLGLTDRVVFFNDWIPYAERENFLFEADIGISLHFEHVETRFSFRTRLLDYIWSGLPMVVTGGDSLSKLIVERDLGVAVPPGDAEAVRDALVRLLSQSSLRSDMAQRFSGAQCDFSWQQVSAPLLVFCNEPQFAADHVLADALHRELPDDKPSLLVRVWQAWRDGGFGGLLLSVNSYVKWRFTR